MGHVDHGKTSLLDAIRQTNVACGEAGGITQHIGAYQVRPTNGEKITFLDTPGHAAFTAMRARGAKVTDIVVLVVAADDGVMPQTIEAINHAKAAGVPIIVAINKIDKPRPIRTACAPSSCSTRSSSKAWGARRSRSKSRRSRGPTSTSCSRRSRCRPNPRPQGQPGPLAEGVVIEAKLDRGRGPVGTVLVQRGTLKVGDIVVAGASWGRVRALIDDKGAVTSPSAGPSVPVEVLGFDGAPEAGDQFAVVENEARAREITDYRVRKRRDTLGSAGTRTHARADDAEPQGQPAGRNSRSSSRATCRARSKRSSGALDKLGNDEVMARIVHSGVGGITESDVQLANASKAVIIGFNVRANAQAKLAADQQGVEIRYYSIIYDLIDDVKAAMSGMLAPTKSEIFLGYAKILQVFNISKAGKVAGCRVTEGKVERGAKVRLLRDNVVIHEGTLSILKRFKDEVKEVPAARNAAWPSPTTRTSARATRSSASRSR